MKAIGSVRMAMCWLLGIAALLAGGCSSGDSKAYGNFKPEKFNYGGEERKYAVYLPKDYDPRKPYPTILFMHGLFEKGNDGKNPTEVGIGPAIKKNPQRFNCVVVFPQTSKDWQAKGQVDLAVATLEDAAKKYNVDSRRVIATGLSNGGAGVWLAGAAYPGRFAGLMPLCAFAEDQAIPSLTHTPIWAFHNSLDYIVGAGGTKRMVEKINQSGGNAQLTVYSSFGHNCWDDAYGDEKVIDWMLNQKR